MTAPLVSIIIPFFNGESLFHYTIDSILNQSFDNFEVVIVDDGSNERNKAALREFGQRDTRIIIHEKPNGGVASARNFGIAASSGSYIALCDQDDTWHPDKLARQVEHLDNHPDCALTYTAIEFIDEHGEAISTPDWAWVSDIDGDGLRALFKQNRIATFTAMFRRNMLPSAEPFRQHLAPSDDWDLWLRLAIDHPFGYIPQVLGQYRVHAGNESRNLMRMQNAENSVIETFVQEHPDAVTRLGKTLVEKKLSALYIETAKLHFQKNDLEEARRYCRKAIKHDCSFSNVLTYASTAYTPTMRNRYAWYKKRLSNLWGSTGSRT